MRKIELTPEQIELARHALGIPNKRRKSYRNRFVIGAGCTDYEQWMAMVALGAAKRVDASRVPFGGDDLFYLTMSGARAALNVADCVGSHRVDGDDAIRREYRGRRGNTSRFMGAAAFRSVASGQAARRDGSLFARRSRISCSTRSAGRGWLK